MKKKLLLMTFIGAMIGQSIYLDAYVYRNSPNRYACYRGRHCGYNGRCSWYRNCARGHASYDDRELYYNDGRRPYYRGREYIAGFDPLHKQPEDLPEQQYHNPDKHASQDERERNGVLPKVTTRNFEPHSIFLSPM